MLDIAPAVVGVATSVIVAFALTGKSPTLQVTAPALLLQLPCVAVAETNVTPLGNGSVFAIATHGGKVYAGGTFVNAGGKAAADYLAVFDGVSWKPLIMRRVTLSCSES